MINVFLDTWPEILFWTGTNKTVLDPLVETVIWMIYNTGPASSLNDMKVNINKDELNNSKARTSLVKKVYLLLYLSVFINIFPPI